MIANPILFGENDNPSSPVEVVKWIKSDGVSYIDTGIPAGLYDWSLMFTLPRVEDFTQSRTPNDIVCYADGNVRSDDAVMRYGFSLEEYTGTWKDYIRNGFPNTFLHITTINTSSITNESDVVLSVGEYFNISNLAQYDYHYRRNIPLQSLSQGRYNSQKGVFNIFNVIPEIPQVKRPYYPKGNLHLFGFPTDESRTDVKIRGLIVYTLDNKSGPLPNGVYRHFVPAVKNGLAGIYDLVTNTFIGNSASSGEILWGSV